MSCLATGRLLESQRTTGPEVRTESVVDNIRWIILEEQLQLDESSTYADRERLGAIIGAELRPNAPHVNLYRLLTD